MKMKMKIFLYLNVIIIGILLFSGCELDNYNSPDSNFFGSIIDIDTGEPIGQSIINGAEIEYIELGYDNPRIQYLRFKSDGTFQNKLMFSGNYIVRAVRGNFFPISQDTIKIKGDTEYHFKTRPYIRIHDTDITFDELKGEVTATFSLERLSGNDVEKVVLLADRHSEVASGLYSSIAIEELKRPVSPEEIITIKMSTLNLTSGVSYYFRVGALIADVGQADYNYSSAIRLNIDNSLVVPTPEIEGKMFDDCESLNGWTSGLTLSLDKDAKQGEYSIKAEGDGSGVVIFQKTLLSPFDATTEIDRETGHLVFSLYISDVSKINWDADGSIEISSSGQCDVEELAWKFNRSLNLVSGWNNLVLKLSDGIPSGGDIDLSAINFMRIYHTGMSGSLIFKIDNIRFY